MEVLIDFSSQRSLLGVTPEAGVLDASYDFAQEGGHPALSGDPNVNCQMSSSPTPLQHPCCEALSRTNSQVNLLGNAYAHDLCRRFTVARRENGRVVSRPLSCRSHIKKYRPKECVRSIHHALEGESRWLSSSSPIRRLNKNDYSSFGPPTRKSLGNIEIATVACGSPGASITNEEDFVQGGRSSLQSFIDNELNRPHLSSSLRSISSSEEPFSGQSELLCSDGSVSSEVIASPDVCGLNELMDFMLDDINTDVICKESFEIQFPAPTAMPSPSQGSLRHPSFCSTFEKPVSFCGLGGIDDQKIKNAPIFIDGHNELVGAISQGFHDVSESQCAETGLSLESCLVQATGLWEGQTNASNGLGEMLPSSRSLAHRAVTVPEPFSASVCSSKYSGGTDTLLSCERNWFHSPSHQDPHSAEPGAQCVDPPSEAQHKEKHDFECSLENEALLSASVSSENYQIQEVAKICDSIRPQTPGLVRMEENILNHFCQISGFGSKRGLFEAPITASSELSTRSESDYDGVRIVHLLIAGADAVATRDMDLASVILVRLKELVSRSGSTMQRVAACFSDGLQCWIEGGRSLDRVIKDESYIDILAAFQILHEISPYIKFGHFTANQAILEAVEEEKRIHIVDFEIMEGIQWPSFMQALATRKRGPPELRITALCRPHAKRGLATGQETGKRLSEFANSLNLTFTYNQLRVDSEEEFRASSLKLIKGEALVVNCMLHLPHMPYRTATSVSSFLQGMRKLSPVILTVVEEELGCKTPALSSYFFEALHHYSAMFDSLEACLSSEPVGRMLVERVFLAPRITKAVTFCGGLSPRSELCTDFYRRNWCSLVSTAGFKSLPLSFHNLSQARLLLGLFKDGFKVDEIGDRLCLGWRSKPLIAASAWN